MSDEIPTPQNANSVMLAMPMGFGERMVWAFRYTFANVGYIIALYLLMAVMIALVMAVMIALVMAVWGAARVGLGGVPFDSITQNASPYAFTILPLVLFAPISLITTWYTISLARLPVLELEHGQRPRFRTLFREAWLRTPDVLSATLVVLLIPAVLYGAAFGLLHLSGRLTHVVAMATTAVVGMLSLIVLIGVILVGPVGANEPRPWWGIIRQAWRLSRGRKVSLLAYLLVVSLLLGVAGFLVQFGAAALSTAAGDGTNAAAVVSVLSVIVNVFLSIWGAPLFVTGLTLYYLESRIFMTGWAPPWRKTLKEGWPISHEPEPPVDLRGRRGWRDLAVLGGVLALALFALMGAIKPKMWMTIRQSAEPAQSTVIQRPPAASPATTWITDEETPTSVATKEPLSTPDSVDPEIPFFDLSTVDGRVEAREWVYRTVRAGHCRRTMPWLAELIPATPNDAWLYLVRGKCRETMGQKADATKDYMTACALGYDEACRMMR